MLNNNNIRIEHISYYVIAKSHQKMLRRLAHKVYTAPLYKILTSHITPEMVVSKFKPINFLGHNSAEPFPVEPFPVEPFPVEPFPVEPSAVEPSAIGPISVEPSPVSGNISPKEWANDSLFLSMLPTFIQSKKKLIDVSNLLELGKRRKKLEVTKDKKLRIHTECLYTERTCGEYHQVLAVALDGFHRFLLELSQLDHSTQPTKEKLHGLVHKAYSNVDIIHCMVYGSAMREHLFKIKEDLKIHFMMVQITEAGPSSEQAAEADPSSEQAAEADLELEALACGDDGRGVDSWEVFHNWLKLVVSYMESVRIASQFVRKVTKSKCTIGVKTIKTPHQGSDMLRLSLLPNLFCWEEVDSSHILDCSNEKAVSTFLEDFYMQTTQPILDWASKEGISSPFDFYTGLAFLRGIKNNKLEKHLKPFRRRFGDLRDGKNFLGTLHCEACMACFIHNSTIIGENELPEAFRVEMAEFKVNVILSFISVQANSTASTQHLVQLGVSKRCCPVCATLLQMLSAENPASISFSILGSHQSIFACTLPPWLPHDVIKNMVERFWVQLLDLLFQAVKHYSQKPRERCDSRTSEGARSQSSDEGSIAGIIQHNDYMKASVQFEN
jgi:hypothetical protein